LPLSDDLKDLIEHENRLAQELLAHIAAAMPKSVEAHSLLAIAHLRRLEFDQAIKHFRETIALDPKHDEALRSLAFCLLAKGDYPAALAAYQHAFQVLSAANALRATALLSHRLGRLDEALAAYDRVLSSAQPTSAEITFALQGAAAALRDAGKVMAADHATRSLIERFRREPIGISSSLITRNNSEDFHEWSYYADKARLAAALNARRPADPAGRFPESFVLPADAKALKAFAAAPGAPKLWIVKPIRSSGGQGIFVTDDVSQALAHKDVVVQRYIDRPFLIDGCKGHCRIYGLVTSADPLRAYVYSEGIVRLAPEPYDPRPDAPGGVSMHITNTALHLEDPRLVISQDASQDDVGAVRSLSAMFRRMAADGLDPQQTFGEIKALVEWFVRLLAADGLFARQAALGGPRAFSHKLFGLDVLVDADGHPWLIEIQRTPAARGQKLVEKINGEMYLTTFRMAQAPLIDDATPPAEAERLRRDDDARRAKEHQIELANRGKFVPLDL
jgi:tetratricopeptide (TPR) repeat protein